MILDGFFSLGECGRMGSVAQWAWPAVSWQSSSNILIISMRVCVPMRVRVRERERHQEIIIK